MATLDMGVLFTSGSGSRGLSCLFKSSFTAGQPREPLPRWVFYPALVLVTLLLIAVVHYDRSNISPGIS
jgi:hypothetical protein